LTNVSAKYRVFTAQEVSNLKFEHNRALERLRKELEAKQNASLKFIQGKN